ASVTSTQTRVDNSAAPETYTVKSGDCLWNIAKKYYGSGSKYTVIYNANKSVIGSNPNLIYPGQVLTIPSA
ncbi:MAG: LysM peptidoglycan-binding domain-containing protein, partial [Ruminococcus sp.]|nr:LysM peptidoglycan-binding domain-containing protein [Ruminococcus sp.]